MDIKNTKEVLDFGLSLFVVGKDLFAGGKFNIAALGELVAISPKAAAAIQDFHMVDDELKDLSSDEILELQAMAVAKLALPSNEKANEIVIKALKAAVAVKDLVLAIA